MEVMYFIMVTIHVLMRLPLDLSIFWELQRSVIVIVEIVQVQQHIAHLVKSDTSIKINAMILVMVDILDRTMYVNLVTRVV
jgi:hypothetical protein